MLRNYVFTLSVLSLLLMGQAVTARAADACQPVFDAVTKSQQLRATVTRRIPPLTVASGRNPRRYSPPDRSTFGCAGSGCALP